MSTRRDIGGSRIEALYPFVRAVASRYASSAAELEEWVQESFVEILRGFDGLRKHEALGAWATTITRRTCWRMMRLREASGNDPFVEEAACGPPLEPPHERELRVAVREALAQVATRQRQVMDLYYLNGMPVRDVAAAVGAPEGTVKRWLHEGRARVREELMKMPETQAIRSKSSQEPFAQFMWWGEGSRPGTMRHGTVWPWTLMDSLLAMQILFSTRKAVRTPEQIAGEVGADLRYVQDTVDRMVRNELMVETEPGLLTDFFFLGRDDQRPLHELLVEYGEASSEVVADSVGDLRALCTDGRLWGEVPSWEELQWVVICLLAANLAVRAKLPDRMADLEPPLRPDGNHFWLFAWQGAYGMADGGWSRNYGMEWVTGCNSFAGGRLGFFWTAQAHRSEWPRGFDVHVLTSTFGPRPIAVSDLTAEVRAARKDADTGHALARLLELGLVRKVGREISPAFPVFTGRFWDEAEPVFSRIGSRIASQAGNRLYGALDGALAELGFEHLREQCAVAKACLLSAATGYTLHRLQKRGVIPSPPPEVEPHWGFWGSEVPCPLLQF
jgi:RNA polymerase sigma factor (sigma-70 family)